MAVETETSEDCAMRTTSALARRKELQIFGNVLEERFEKKHTSHICFSAEDAKDMKILNRTIKIDVQNREMISEADTKLVDDACRP